MTRVWTILSLVLVSIGLAGCGATGFVDPTAQPTADTDRAYVLLAVDENDTVGFGKVWYMAWRRDDPHGVIRERVDVPSDEWFWFSNTSGFITDERDGTMYYLQEARPGFYQFEFISFNQFTDSWTLSPTLVRPMRFEARRGEVAYIGTVTLGRGTENLLVPASIEDDRASALLFLAENYAIELPTYTDVGTLDPSTTFNAITGYWFDE